MKPKIHDVSLALETLTKLSEAAQDAAPAEPFTDAEALMERQFAEDTGAQIDMRQLKAQWLQELPAGVSLTFGWSPAGCGIHARLTARLDEAEYREGMILDNASRTQQWLTHAVRRLAHNIKMRNRARDELPEPRI